MLTCHENRWYSRGELNARMPIAEADHDEGKHGRVVRCRRGVLNASTTLCYSTFFMAPVEKENPSGGIHKPIFGGGNPKMRRILCFSTACTIVSPFPRVLGRKRGRCFGKSFPPSRILAIYAVTMLAYQEGVLYEVIRRLKTPGIEAAGIFIASSLMALQVSTGLLLTRETRE